MVRYCRDLGGAINTTAKQQSNVLNDRIGAALATLRRFRFLPHDADTKAQFIHIKVLAGALYGIECSEPSGAMIQKLQSAIVDALGFHSARACNAIAFELSAKNSDIDPHVQQLLRRTTMFRRMWAKHSSMREDIIKLQQHYLQHGFIGTSKFHSGPNATVSGPAPPPGHLGRAKWKSPYPLRGPVALMLYSVGQVDATMDADFRIHTHHQQPMELLSMPFQQVKPQITNLAVEARTRWVATTRSDLVGLKDLDREALKMALKKRKGDDLRILKHSISLSSWANDKLYDAGQSKTRACELCGTCDTQTTRHLLYHCTCPALVQAREEATLCLKGASIKDIPYSLQVGLPPIMATRYDDSFWGTPWQQCTKPDYNIGCFDPNCSAASQTRDQLNNLLAQSKHDSARDLVRSLRGNFENLDFPDLDLALDSPPEQPNVYSDGGVSCPHSPSWSTGTFGVFWPHRTLCLQPLSDTEVSCANHTTTAEGIEIWGNLYTPACSSTRAELIGAIIAISAKGAVHLATDSLAFILRARKYIRRIQLNLPELCWNRKNDGDLWGVFWKCCLTKGVNSIRITKVKGHATEAHIRNSLSNVRDKWGNDKADELASRAHDDHLQAGIIADFYANRHNAYVCFIVSVHDFLLHMFQAIGVARDRHKRDPIHGSNPANSKVQISKTLPFANSDNAVTLGIHNHPPEVFAEIDHGSKKILTILADKSWVMAPSDTQGTTWIELVILFFLHGGTYEDLGLVGKNGAEKASTIKQVLTAYKLKARRVITHCLNPFSHVFFKPSKIPHLRLRAIGYSNHTPCIGGLPVLSHDQNSFLVRCLVALRHSFTRNFTILWEQDQLELVSRKLSLRGSPPDIWTSRCSLFSAFDNVRVGERLEAVASPLVPNSAELWLKCPICLHVQNCTHTTLVKGAVWKPVHCKVKHCKATRSSAKWLCTCNKLWYTCDIHACVGHLAGRSAPQPRASMSKRTHEASFDSQVNSPPAVRIRLQPSVSKTTQEDRKRSCQSVSLLPEPKRPAIGAVLELCATNACASDINRTTPEPSLVRPEAGVGVSRVKAKRRHRPSDPETAPRIRKKRRVTETELHLDALASIKRLRESRAMDPG